jgi:tol-pal system protein YbgF
MRARPLLPALLAAAASAALLPGCARSAEERHLDEMRETIEEVQADRDGKERDMMAESAAPPRADGAAARQPAFASQSPASLPIGPEPGGPGEGEAMDTDDPSPRPTLRVVGTPRIGRNGWREDQVEQSNLDPQQPGASSGYASGSLVGGSAAAGRPSALDPAAKPAYDSALALVGAHQYDRALEALAAFLVKYPDHPYADNAMYWRGECYFAKGDYLHAAEQFEGTVTRFPAGNKAPDALLKLGMSHMKLGNPTKAKECFDRLALTYPQSEAARRIPPVTTSSVMPRGSGTEDHR